HHAQRHDRGAAGADAECDRQSGSARAVAERLLGTSGRAHLGGLPAADPGTGLMVDLLLTIQVVTWVFVTFLFVVSRTSSLFHPFTYYTAFHGIVFVLRPLLIVHANFNFAFSYMRFT